MDGKAPRSISGGSPGGAAKVVQNREGLRV